MKAKVEEVGRAPDFVSRPAFEAVDAVLDQALSRRVEGAWVERVVRERISADVELPDEAPELWDPVGYSAAAEALSQLEEASEEYEAASAKLSKLSEGLPEEHRAVLEGQQKRDDGLIAFTKRVWGPWFGDYESCMGVSEINNFDSMLYEELKGVRNRMNGRKEKFPFPTVKDRNKVLIEKIHAGEIDPPQNYRAFVNLNNVAKRQGRSITS